MSGLLVGALLLAACSDAASDTATRCPTDDDPREDDAITAVTTLPTELGDIRVRARGPRRGEALPVALVVQGAWDADGTTLAEGTPSPRVADGVVAVHVDLPGRAATTAADDRRGPIGRAVLGEVLAWIRGDQHDTDGCALVDRLPAATGPRVLLGLSNGGNLAMATLADPTLATDDIAGLVTWETPAGAPFVTVQWGRTAPTIYAPHTCARGEDGAIACDFPYDQLAVAGGEVCVDRTGNGCDPSDVRLPGVLDPVSRSRMLPPAVAAALEATDLLPRDHAGAALATAWWAQRDAAQLAAAAVTRDPARRFLLLASARDHVLPYPDHPHVFGLGEALQAAGASWTRLNPGRAWLAGVGGENAVDAPLTLADAQGRLLTEVEETPLEAALAAAVREVADVR